MASTESPNVVARQLQYVCEWIVASVSDLSEDQLRWQPGITAPSIRFHLFHMARCADATNAGITETEQRWHRDQVASSWGLNPADLGFKEFGAELDGEAAMRLPLPAATQLMAYVDQALGDLDATLSTIDDREFMREVPGYRGGPMTIGFLVTDQLEHLCRHLGMIEALRGVQGLSGTATI